jgi:hypothetical protein
MALVKTSDVCQPSSTQTSRTRRSPPREKPPCLRGDDRMPVVVVIDVAAAAVDVGAPPRET